MEHGSLEYFRWFYSGRFDRQGEMEERWHEDLVLHQSADIPDTAGTFHGYEGLNAVMAELGESYRNIRWDPVRVEDLGDDRYLVLISVTGKGIGSGIELKGELAHIVTLRDGRATRLDTYLSMDAAREATGPS